MGSASPESSGVVPFIESCKFVLTLLGPWIPSLEIVLIVQTATHVAASWNPGGNILPLHSLTSQLDENDIFLCRPGALPFRGGLLRVG